MNSFKILCAFIVLTFFACNPPDQNSTSDVNAVPRIDTKNTLDNFYGYEPKEILAMTIEEQIALVKKYNIKPADLIILKLNAESAIFKKEHIRDSIEIQKVYDRIERKLKN